MKEYRNAVKGSLQPHVMGSGLSGRKVVDSGPRVARPFLFPSLTFFVSAVGIMTHTSVIVEGIQHQTEQRPGL